MLTSAKGMERCAQGSRANYHLKSIDWAGDQHGVELLPIPAEQTLVSLFTLIVRKIAPIGTVQGLDGMDINRVCDQQEFRTHLRSFTERLLAPHQWTAGASPSYEKLVTYGVAYTSS